MGRHIETATGADLQHELRELLTQQAPANQQEICKSLAQRGFVINQSTVSRLLRKLQAVKTSDGQGNIVYKLSHDGTMSVETGGVASLIVSIQSNGSLIVIQTTTGSAQLVAQYLDRARLPQILGTLAGDDTIFVAPSTSRVMPSTLEAIRQALAPTDA